MQRIKLYSQISTSLVCLSNEKLKQILADSKPMHEGIGGKSALISIDDTPVFVKKVPLVKDIIWIHHQWLDHIYFFAGKYRTVNMSKGGFLFSAAHLIPNLMMQFEQNVLNKYTPGSQFKTMRQWKHCSQK